MLRVAGVLLAAGASTRLGEPKQLLEFDGEPLIRILLTELIEGGCTDVAVVLGDHFVDIVPVIEDLRVTWIAPSDWEEGMARSVRAAADFARGYDALLLAVCDQPALDRNHVAALIEAFRDGAVQHAVASSYGEVLGVPAILPPRMFPDLLELQGDEGARRVLRGDSTTHALPWPDGAYDLDTPEAVRAWRAALSSSPRTRRR